MKAIIPLALATWLVAPAAAERYDILIRNAHIVDGSGNPWYPGDIGITDGRIRTIRTRIDASAGTILDVKGLTVTPGFIDMHTHSDYTLLRDGNGESKIRQGVTLEVIGEGSSAAPRKPGMDELSRTEGITERWTTFREYFDLLGRKGISVNLMSYVGAGQLRRTVIGDVFRKPTAAELDRMKALARQAMEDGALGLVTALETTTGAHPDAVPGVEELVELTKAVAPYGGLYASHLRNQTDHFIDAIDEVGTIAERAHVAGEIFHIKSAGKPYFGQMARALDEIRAMRRRGVDVTADVYPYIAAAHGLATEVPQWAKDGGREQFVARLKDPSLRPRLRKETDEYIETKYYNEEKQVGGYAAVMISSTEKPNDPAIGKTIAEIAAERHVTGADAALDLLAENHGNVGIVMFYMSEADMRLALADPDVSICSDGSAISPAFGGRPHPRYYGTFPRILGKYVRDEKLLRLEDAVRKMTSLPAQRLGLRDRGVLREGAWADVVVFDPATIIDTATFDDPHQYPVGIEYVLVNGTIVVQQGKHTGARPGRVLYGPGRRETATTSGDLAAARR